MLFHEVSHFLQIFFKKLIKTSKHDRLLQKLQVLAKSMIFIMLFVTSHFLQLFSEKIIKTSKHNGFLEKSQVFAKSMSFHAFSRNDPSFGTDLFFMLPHEINHYLQLFSEKFIKTSKYDGLLEKWHIFAKPMIFHGFSRNHPLFTEEFIRTSKHDGLLDKSQVLAKSMIFHVFSRNEPLFATFF